MQQTVVAVITEIAASPVGSSIFILLGNAAHKEFETTGCGQIYTHVYIL